MGNRKIAYCVGNIYFATREEAIAEQARQLEEGRTPEFIEVYDLSDEDFSGMERLAEERNRLIDWQG